MNSMVMSEDIISNWQPQHERLFDKHVLKLNHRLIETGLFTPRGARKADRALPERRARPEIDGRRNRKPDRIYGELGEATGAESDRRDREGSDVDEHPPRDGLGAGIPRTARQGIRRVRGARSRLQDVQAQPRRADLVAEREGVLPRRYPGAVALADQGVKRVYLYPRPEIFVEPRRTSRRSCCARRPSTCRITAGSTSTRPPSISIPARC